MSYWFPGRKKNGQRHLYSVGGVVVSAVVLGVALLPLFAALLRWLRDLF